LIWLLMLKCLIFRTLQVIFWFEKTRKCSDKSTYLRADNARLGCGICSRISTLQIIFWFEKQEPEHCLTTAADRDVLQQLPFSGFNHGQMTGVKPRVLTRWTVTGFKPGQGLEPGLNFSGLVFSKHNAELKLGRNVFQAN